jgi:DNA replication protein DnaD
VLVRIGHCVDTRGKNVNISYIDKVAKTWADEGIDSGEKARQHVEESGAAAMGGRAVMRRMGISGRSPGQTERDYYKKWTTEWGFTQEAIQYAMEGVEFPSGSPFKYLDTILLNLHQKNLHTSREISEYNLNYERRTGLIKEVMRALEYSRLNVAPNHRQFYEKWEAAGYRHGRILLACTQSKHDGSRKFGSVDALLKEWEPLQTEEEVRKYMRCQNTTEKRIGQVYACAGIKKHMGDADRKWYLTHTQDHKMSHDVLMYAAEISSIANDPASFLRKVLSDWAKKGVTTLRGAMEQNLNRFTADIKNGKAFEQHRYTDDDGERRKLEALRIVENPDG